MSVRGKVIVVTGAASGIGRAIAERMIGEGAIVIAADISTKVESIGETGLSTVHVDITKPESVDRMIGLATSRHGRIDGLVNSAGVAADTSFLDVSRAQFDRILEINLHGTMVVGQAVARAMGETGGGSIVNVVSVSGMIGNRGRAVYGASKAAVIQLSRVMAVELAPLQIRVNCLAPGPIETAMSKEVHTPAIKQLWLERTPLGRYGRPEELAGPAVFLCSDDSSYMTGQVLVVDGGFLCAGLNDAIASSNLESPFPDDRDEARHSSRIAGA